MKHSNPHTVNHLASRLEHQKNFKLPLQTKIAELEKLTVLARQALEGVFPAETAQGLRVIHYETNTLTISTDNHTIANHLNYMRQSILALLQQTHPKFLPIQQLKFRVVMLNHRFTKTDTPRNTLQGNPSVKNVTSCELTDLTKQNITQLAELVTSNKRLVQVLQKLTKASAD